MSSSALSSTSNPTSSRCGLCPTVALRQENTQRPCGSGPAILAATHFQDAGQPAGCGAAGLASPHLYGELHAACAATCEVIPAPEWLLPCKVSAYGLPCKLVNRSTLVTDSAKEDTGRDVVDDARDLALRTTDSLLSCLKDLDPESQQLQASPSASGMEWNGMP